MNALLIVVLLQSSDPIPLVPGAFWEYRESYTEHLDGLDSTEDSTTRFELRGRSNRLFLNQTGGFDPTSGPVEVSDGWIRLAPWTGEDALPLPLAPGREGPRAEGGGAWIVEDSETVTVPAGTFETLRCAFRTPTAQAVLWIAPGVGVVKETQGVPGRRPDIERVLLRFGPRGLAHP